MIIFSEGARKGLEVKLKKLMKERNEWYVIKRKE